MHPRLPSLVSVLLSGLVVWLMIFSLGFYRSVPWWFYLTLLAGVWWWVDLGVKAVFERFVHQKTNQP